MRKILFALLTAMIAVTADAQFVSFPRFGKNLKMCSDPILGMEGLHVGDEGYVTFEVVNEGDSVYTGPIYLRIVEREHSVQVWIVSAFTAISSRACVKRPCRNTVTGSCGC